MSPAVTVGLGGELTVGHRPGQDQEEESFS